MIVYSDGRGTELHRETVKYGACCWCGCKTTDKRNGRLYVYTVVDGAGMRPHPRILGAPAGQGRVFCSLGCYRAYNG